MAAAPATLRWSSAAVRGERAAAGLGEARAHARAAGRLDELEVAGVLEHLQLLGEHGVADAQRAAQPGELALVDGRQHGAQLRALARRRTSARTAAS
jgi:hypothetical protein